jgi:nicotinate-nucleotide adenylyltransferase
MYISIFGGAFNPAHIGHKKIIEKIFRQFNYDKIFVIPTYIPPHKKNIDFIKPEHKINMLNLCFKNYSNITISDIELKKAKISYTYDTVFELKKKYNKIDLIIGYDNFIELHTWYKINRLIKLINRFIVISRPDYKKTYNQKYYKLYKNKFIFINDIHLNISSSEIRNMIKNKKTKNLINVLDKNVAHYIIKNNLYVK